MEGILTWLGFGEPLPEVVEKKNSHQRIHGGIKPGKTRMFIEKLIERIDMLIDIQLKHDKEFLNPRG